MKKTYCIAIEPTTVTRQGIRNIENFLTDISAIQGISVDDSKLEFTCDSNLERILNDYLEKYSIVNLIGSSKE